MDKETQSDFMARTELLLSSKGMRLKDIYKALPQVTPQHIHKWKTGSLPSLATAVAVAKWLGTSVEWLVTGEGIRSTSPDTDATVLALKERLRQIADIAEGKKETKTAASENTAAR